MPQADSEKPLLTAIEENILRARQMVVGRDAMFSIARALFENRRAADAKMPVVGAAIAASPRLRSVRKLTGEMHRKSGSSNHKKTMTKKSLSPTFTSLIVALFIGLAAVSAAAQDSLSVAEIRTNGVGGFPQPSAAVLVDNENLKVSIANDSNYLAVQAVIWNDPSEAAEKGFDGRTVGDYSVLLTTFGNGDERQPKKDRDYYVNPLPHKKGLYYTIYYGKQKSERSSLNGKQVIYETVTSSPLMDLNGKGKIEYLSADGRKVRVDTMLIPLSEFGGKSLKNLRVCYFASSPNPALRLNSCGYEPVAAEYFDFIIPVRKYRKFDLKNTLTDELNRLAF